MRTAALGLIGLAACGRLGFDATPTDAPGAPFQPASGGCLEADSGPFVEVAAFPTSGGGYGVWAAPPFVLVADTTGGLHSLRFDGTTFTKVGDLPSLGWVEAVYSDGTHYYVGAPGTGFYVVDLAADGSLAVVAQDTTTLSEARRGWPANGMLFVPDGPDGLYAARFDGSAVTLVGTPIAAMSWAQSAWARDSRVLFSDGAYLRVLDFDGSTFTDAIAPNSGHTGGSRVWSDGSLVLAANADGITAYRLAGNTLTELDTLPTGATARDVWSDGQHVFAAAENGMVFAAALVNDRFTLLGTAPIGTQGLGVFGDGTYIYANDISGGVHAFTGFACRRW